MLPVLGKFFSPIPVLDDVTREDYLELKAAARAKPATVGAQAAVALSQTDLFNPTFYVASNLPEGTKFTLFIRGVSETLLNQISFSNQTETTISRHLGKASAIQVDGKPLTRGDYTVYVAASENNSPEVKGLVDTAHLAPASPNSSPADLPAGMKILSSKTYFLGGKKDAIYTARLKEFHDKLMDKSKTELMELKQFETTLSSELSETNAEF